MLTTQNPTSGTSSDSVNKLSHFKKGKQVSKQAKTASARSCYNCGGPWPHQSKRCPAYGKVCMKCGQKNHFAAYCSNNKASNGKPRKAKPNHVNTLQSEEAVYPDQDETNEYGDLFRLNEETDAASNPDRPKSGTYNCEL